MSSKHFSYKKLISLLVKRDNALLAFSILGENPSIEDIKSWLKRYRKFNNKCIKLQTYPELRSFEYFTEEISKHVDCFERHEKIKLLLNEFTYSEELEENIRFALLLKDIWSDIPYIHLPITYFLQGKQYDLYLKEPISQEHQSSLDHFFQLYNNICKSLSGKEDYTDLTPEEILQNKALSEWIIKNTNIMKEFPNNMFEDE